MDVYEDEEDVISLDKDTLLSLVDYEVEEEEQAGNRVQYGENKYQRKIKGL